MSSITTDQGIVHYEVYGRGTPVILLHGWLGSWGLWQETMADLGRHYRTYALDSIYDFGLSVRRRKLSKPDDLLAWLDEVINALVPEGAPGLAGLSYGGWLAALYAQRFPGKVSKLVLLTPAATVLPVSAVLVFHALLALVPLPGFRKKFYFWLLNDSVKSGESGRVYVDQAVVDWETAARCFQPMPLINATVLSDQQLADFKVPTLFLVGEHEKVYSAQKAVSRLNRVSPQVQTGIIPGAGHDLWAVQAGLVNRLVLDFLGG